MKKLWIIACILIIPTLLFAQKYEIKFASLAPDGTTWMKVMREFDQAIREESNGQLGFKLYPGGVAGDEKDVLRKIKLGQLHSAGFTGVGMGEILPEVRILDSPLLFRSYDEVDYINAKFYDRFASMFEEQGFVLLGWAEVGFVYIFSDSKVQNLAELRKTKMWSWEGDPVAEATFRALDVNTVPLSVINVLTSLQTGMVNSVYISPLAILALQWFTKLNYMLDFPLTDAAGAVLISKRQYDRLPENLQEILMRNAKTYLTKLMKQSRQDNINAKQTLKENGIEIIPAPRGPERQEFLDKGKAARRLMAGKLYPLSLVEEIEQALAEYRKNQESSK